MKRKNIALLTLAPLLLLPLGATSGSTDPLTAEVSPDGVALWDFTQDSTVWGRTFDFNPPAGVHETEIFSLCEFEGPGSGAATWACLEPYIADVWWTAPGMPGAWEEVIIREDDSGVVPELPGPGISTVAVTSKVFEVTTFTIYDNVDCCDNKNAEGYVKFSAWVTGSTYSVSSALFCENQGTSSGDCNVERQNNDFLVIDVGPNNCDGYKGKVEFWDDDGASDDRMDISSKTGDAVADIEATLDATTLPCDDEDNLWWSQLGNENSPLGDRCHGIGFGSFCELTGQGDGTGDNDDAGLNFRVTSPPP